MKLDLAIEHLEKAAAEDAGHPASAHIATALLHLTEAKSKLRGEL